MISFTSTRMRRREAVVLEGDQDRILYETAPLACARADELCRTMPGEEYSCAWYHGVWQYFRILEVVASPRVQNSFYSKVLKDLASAGTYRKVLLSGTSDYAMLQTLLDAYRDRCTDPQVTIVDRCETPLFLNRWFAERNTIGLATAASDLLEYRSTQLFDLVCTHSFLGNFSPEQRPLLVSRWRELLRPGGKVVTMNRIRPGVNERQGFSPAMADDFINRVRLAGQRTSPCLDLSPDILENRSRIYTARYRTYPVSSADDLRELFIQQGFRLDFFDVEGRPGQSSGPSMPGQAMRVYLVATRV